MGVGVGVGEGGDGGRVALSVKCDKRPLGLETASQTWLAPS